MAYGADELMRVEGELRAPIAKAQLVRFTFHEPIDRVMAENDSYRLDLCLTPRPGNARGRYPARLAARHFERLGNLFMVPPGETLQAVSDGCCQQASILCEFNQEQVAAWFESDIEWTDHHLLAGLDIRERKLHMLLQRLAEEARHPGFASETLVELIAAQIAIELLRYGKALDAGVGNGGLAAWRLRKIEERLTEEEAPPTLAELARLCQISVRQLTRGFRTSRGCSIGDYLASHRIARARQLLATDRSVKAIAYTLGFASPSSFCFAFKRATGQTPTQFRQSLHSRH